MFLNKKIRKTLLIVLFLLIVDLLFFNKLFFPELRTIVTPDFKSSDIYHGYLPLKHFYSQKIKNFELPLWSKNLNNGLPMLAQGQIGTFNLINFLTFIIFPFGIAINIFYLVNTFINLLFSYLLAKEFKVKDSAAILFSIVFSFNGFFISHLTHLDIFHAASLLTLELFLVKKSLKNPRFWPILSFVVSQQIFTGSQQIVLISVFCIFIFFLFNCYLSKQKKKQLVINFVFLIASLLFALVLASVQLLPSRKYLNLSLRKKGLKFSEVTQYSYHPKDFLLFLNPYILGSPKTGTYVTKTPHVRIFWENNAYLGITPLFIMGFFLLQKQRSKVKKGLTLGIFLSFLLVLGKHSPLYFFYEFWPFNLFRVPSRFLLVSGVFLALFAMFGIDFIDKNYRQKKVVKITIYLLIVLSFLDLYRFFNSYHLIEPHKKWFEKPELVRFLQEKKDNPKVFSLGFENDWFDHFSSKGWQNPEFYYRKREDPINYANLYYNINQANVENALPLIRNLLSRSFIINNINVKEESLILTPNATKALQQNSVEYFITPLKVASNLEIEMVYQSESGTNVYRINKSLPMVNLVNDSINISTFTDYVKYVNQKDFSFENSALTEREINFDSQNEDQSNKINNLIVQDGLISFETKTQNKTLAVIKQFNYPGWKGFIDNEEVEILNTNINSMGVVIPPGNHKIMLRFKPAVFRKGLLISLSGHFLLIIYLPMVFVVPSLYQNKNLKTLLPFSHPDNN